MHRRSRMRFWRRKSYSLLSRLQLWLRNRWIETRDTNAAPGRSALWQARWRESAAPKLGRTPEGSNDQAISRRLRCGPDLRLWTSAGRQGADQEIRSRIRSSALPPRRGRRARHDLPGIDRERRVHGCVDDEADGRGRSQASGRYHRRRPRGVALDAAGAARRRAERRERGPGGKAVKVTP